MPKDISFDVTVTAKGGAPVVLPEGEKISNAQFVRDGQDLFLQMPNGHTIKVEGYFGHDPAPDIATQGGARLTPDLVEAFLVPQHAGEYAENKPAHTANDATPAGKVTEIVGDVTITRADGTKVQAELGTPVFQGDVIETSAKGAVNILFADNTTFAISESARMSVDEFAYNGESHEGSSFFSMLQGLFVYTSGLIGKEDPGQVGINTPVGSIGIRGTVVAGQINPEGQDSTITVIDGAIVIANDGGMLELSDSFGTATLSSYSTAPVASGTMSADTFTATYGSLAPVAGTTFEGVSNGTFSPSTTTTTTTTAPDSGTTQEQQSAPDSSTQDQQTAPLLPDGGAQEQLQEQQQQQLQFQQFQQLQQPVQEGQISPAPQPATGFDTTTGQTTFGDSGATTFDAGATTGTTTTTFDSAATTTDPAQTAGGTDGGGTTTTGAPPLTAGFMFSSLYTLNTPSTGDDGVPLLGLGWPGGAVIGTVTWANTVNPVTVSVAGNFSGRELVYNTVTTGGLASFDTEASTGSFPIFNFNPATNEITLVNPLAMVNGLNGPYNFTVTVTDDVTGAQAQHNFVILVKDPGYALFVGDVGGMAINPPGTSTPDLMPGTAANEFMWGRGGNDTLLGLGGQDILIGDAGDDTLAQDAGAYARMDGGTGNDTLIVKNETSLDSTRSFFDGGAGNDILQLGNPTLGGLRLDFDLSGLGNITNIEEIQITKSDSFPSDMDGNDIVLDLADVFSFTGGGNTLTISNMPGLFGSTVTVNTAGITNLNLDANILAGTGTGQITGELISNGQTVTLIIQQGTGSPTDGIQVTVN